MNWTKKDLEKLKGKVKSIDIPPEPKNGVKIPKSIGKYKLHIISVLEKSGLNFRKEFIFDDVRKFRFDWAIEELKIAIEYEGIFSETSGHTTLTGYKKDVVKYNLATKRGWKMLRYTADNYLDFENDLKILTQKNYEK
ncbi:hypothetical protein [Chryseobacterium gambrini]|uniref:hypothetical protein n=1 Tax=Chryseobacterium gambrini TaxID=373672 RepID=UPI003D12923F